MARDQLPIDGGESFIGQLEEAVAEGDANFIDANLPRLENLIALYQDRIFELANIQHRARLIRNQHERPAVDRMKQ